MIYNSCNLYMGNYVTLDLLSYNIITSLSYIINAFSENATAVALEDIFL